MFHADNPAKKQNWEKMPKMVKICKALHLLKKENYSGSENPENV